MKCSKHISMHRIKYVLPFLRSSGVTSQLCEKNVFHKEYNIITKVNITIYIVNSFVSVLSDLCITKIQI